MMRNNVQRLGEHVTAALLSRTRRAYCAGRTEASSLMARACPWCVTLTQPRESPGSGDGLSPGWRQAWARRESWHGRRGTCS
jgi:hypothetical protein